MKNFKRTIAFVLALMLLVSGAAMAEGYGFNASGLPIVSEPITLKILTQDPSSTTTFSKAGDAPVWKYLSEKLGVNFEFESYSGEDLSTKLSLIMADPDTYPDIFWQSTLTEEQVASYGAQGMLLNMNDLIEQYGENIKAAWAQNTAYKGYAASTDGNVYALPSYNMPASPWSIMVNDRWLENCGIEEYPKNLDEFKEMLVKFLDMDANGNGDPTDEIPLQGNTSSLFQVLGNACGMMVDWPWIGCIYGSDKDSTEAKAIFMDERYKYLISYVHDLYAEGLINSDMFTVTGDEETARRLNDQYGAMAFMNFGQAEEKYDPNNFTSMPLMTSQFITEPVGFVGPGYQPCMAAISGYTQYPEAAVRFLDYCMTADGTALFVSTENMDYAASGVSQEVIDLITPYISEDKGREFAGTYGNRFLPILTQKVGEFANNIDKTKYENLTKVYPEQGNTVMQYTYSLKFTEAENEVVAQYKTDIDTYVKQKMNEWIVNGKIDEEWDAYIDQLKAMNVDKLTEVHQNAVNRWYGVN